MTRLVLWTLGGVVLGLMIHLVVILILPQYAAHDLWDRVSAISEPTQLVVLDKVETGADNPLALDPLFAEAVCRLDLADGPGQVVGPLPDAFWSIAVFDTEGTAIYSTTHRASSNNRLNLGIFNPAQTKLLSQQEISAEADLLVVESAGDDVFAAVRLAPPHPEMLERYRDILAALTCTNLGT